MIRTAVDERFPTASVLGVRLTHELFALARGDLDPVDTVLFIGVLQANIDQITSTPALQRRYATFAAPPPDEERRPISILRLSVAVRLPFETVRRRIGRLVGEGLFTLGPQGVSITNAQLRSQPGSQRLGEMYDRMAAGFANLEALRFFEGQSWFETMGSASGVEADAAAPLRSASRIAGDFALRMLDIGARELGGVSDGLLFTTLMEMNVQSAIGAALCGADEVEILRDLQAHVRPVRIARLADVLGINAETVRRRLAGMEASGCCSRSTDGYVVELRFLQASLKRNRTERERHLMRLYRQVAELGAVSQWRAHPIVAASTISDNIP